MYRGLATRTLGRLGLLMLVVGGVALAAPSLAAAAQPTCGEVLHHSVKLTMDLNCTDSNGLYVGANGITINLNGHTISGNNASFSYGVDNTGDFSGGPDSGYNNVTVENGTVTGFMIGVIYDGTGGGKIEYVHANNNDAYYQYTGIAFWDSHNGVIAHSSANDNPHYGFYLYQDHHVTLSNSKGNTNGYDGVYDYYSLDTISHDTTNHNSGEGVYVDYPITVNTPKGQIYYRIMDTTANHNGDDGFDITDNAPRAFYQAAVFGNTAKYNSAWGYWAEQQVKSNTTNGAKGNAAGRCFHVKCHTI